MRGVVVVALVGACGGGGATPGGDAPGADAPVIDAAHADAPPVGAMAVTVYGDGVDVPAGHRVPGITVYFVAPDQTTQAIIADVTGTATASAPANTTIFVPHRHGDTEWFIDVFAGVVPGDGFVDGDPRMPADTTVVASGQISHPAFSDAMIYKLQLSCSTGNQSSGLVIPYNALACPQETDATAVVTALDSQGQLGYTQVRHLNLATQVGTVALPALQPAGTLTTTVANLPPLVTTVEILARRRDGTDPTPFDMADFYAIPSGSSAVGSAPLAPVGDHTNLLATLTIASSTTVDFAGDLPLADTATVDAAQMVRIGSATHYDVASHTVHWTESSFGVDPTALVAQLTWRTGTGTGINMQVVAPHTGPALVIPPLPAALQSLSDTAGSGPPMPGIHARVYASKTYDDVLNGRIGDTAVWHTAF